MREIDNTFVSDRHTATMRAHYLARSAAANVLRADSFTW